MSPQPLQLLSSDDFDTLDARFQAAHKKREGHLPHEEQVKNYERFYTILVRNLKAVATHSEDGGDGEISTSRHVDPSDVTVVVVCDTRSIYRCRAIEAVLTAVAEARVPHLIIFDSWGGSYIAVLPDGTVYGCSDTEDLLAVDRQREA